ncbi:hypothetical protein CZ765_02715 [Corynebacterium casei]|nr:hypothetical protein CZ765_02715 [Corynebacterium casei]
MGGLTSGKTGNGIWKTGVYRVSYVDGVCAHVIVCWLHQVVDI